MPSLTALMPEVISPRLSVRIDDYATSLAISPEGPEAAVASASGAVWRIDLAAGSSRQVTAHEGGALAVAWAPCTLRGLGPQAPGSGALATSGQDGRVALVDAAGEVRRVGVQLEGWIEHLAWSRRGELAFASGRRALIVDGRGELIAEATEHGSTVSALAWAPQGDQLACASYGGVRIFDGASGALVRELLWKGSLISLTWSPDGKVIACGSQDCSVHFWRLASGEDSEMRGYPSKPRALAWDAASTLLATGGDSTVCVWSFAARGPGRASGPEGTAPLQLERHTDVVTALAFHPRRGLLASAARDGSVCIWETPRSRARAEARLEGSVVDIAWTRDGRELVAITSAGEVAVLAPSLAR